MTREEEIYLTYIAAEKVFADFAADVVIVVKQYRFLMARCGVGRV